MNAPVSTSLPADKQREYDEALVAFWNDGSATLLYAIQNWSIGVTGGKMPPHQLTWEDDYTAPHWLALTTVDGELIGGEGATALGALADMMIRAEAKAAEFAQERYEDNMAGAR